MASLGNMLGFIGISHSTGVNKIESKFGGRLHITTQVTKNTILTFNTKYKVRFAYDSK